MSYLVFISFSALFSGLIGAVKGWRSDPLGYGETKWECAVAGFIVMALIGAILSSLLAGIAWCINNQIWLP